jgi:hypothetical protein
MCVHTKISYLKYAMHLVSFPTLLSLNVRCIITDHKLGDYACYCSSEGKLICTPESVLSRIELLEMICFQKCMSNKH